MSETLNQTETEEGTTSDEKTLTLREELAEQLTKQTKEVTEDAETSEQETTEEETTKEEVAEEVEAEEEAPEEEKAEVVEATDADVPNNWSAEEKKVFEDIPDEIVAEDGTKISLKAMKDVVLHRNEGLLKAFNEKSREAATAKKGSKEWNNLLDPYKPQLTAAGMEPQQWIGTILKDVHRLQANPKSVIKELIGAYKVSASDLGFTTEQSQDEDDSYVESDPKVAKLETTVADLRAEIDSMKNDGIQRKNQSVQDEILAFKEAKDSKGNLTHPHFDEARDEMGILMETGKAKTVQEAYDMSPAVKSKGLKIVKSSDENKLALKKAREEAAKAKKAGKTIKTRSGKTNNPNAGLSLRDELKMHFRAQQ